MEEMFGPFKFRRYSATNTSSSDAIASIRTRRQKLLILVGAVSAFVLIPALLAFQNIPVKMEQKDNDLSDNLSASLPYVPYLMGEQHALNTVFQEENRKSKQVDALYKNTKQQLVSELADKMRQAVRSEIRKERNVDIDKDIRSWIPRIVDAVRTENLIRVRDTKIMNSIRTEIRQDVGDIPLSVEREVRNLVESRKITNQTSRKHAQREVETQILNHIINLKHVVDSLLRQVFVQKSVSRTAGILVKDGKIHEEKLHQVSDDSSDFRFHLRSVGNAASTGTSASRTGQQQLLTPVNSSILSVPLPLHVVSPLHRSTHTPVTMKAFTTDLAEAPHHSMAVASMAAASRARRATSHVSALFARPLPGSRSDSETLRRSSASFTGNMIGKVSALFERPIVTVPASELHRTSEPAVANDLKSKSRIQGARRVFASNSSVFSESPIDGTNSSHHALETQDQKFDHPENSSRRIPSFREIADTKGKGRPRISALSPESPEVSTVDESSIPDSTPTYGARASNHVLNPVKAARSALHSRTSAQSASEHHPDQSFSSVVPPQLPLGRYSGRLRATATWRPIGVGTLSVNSSYYGNGSGPDDLETAQLEAPKRNTSTDSVREVANHGPLKLAAANVSKSNSISWGVDVYNSAALISGAGNLSGNTEGDVGTQSKIRQQTRVALGHAGATIANGGQGTLVRQPAPLLRRARPSAAVVAAPKPLFRRRVPLAVNNPSPAAAAGHDLQVGAGMSASAASDVVQEVAVPLMLPLVLRGRMDERL